MDLENRNIRQRDLIPTRELENTIATVVGVGAGGRQVAIQLATIGVGKLSLIDHDKVKVENLAAQGYLESDLGSFKVETTKELCQRINSNVEIETVKRKFSNLMFGTGILFCCVDSIDTRKRIFEAVKDRCNLFIDGRMSAEFIRVLTAYDEKSKEYYNTQLFPGNEAHVGACTSKTTIYCANISAGIRIAQFAKWLRGLRPLDSEIQFNVLTNEMIAKE